MKPLFFLLCFLSFSAFAQTDFSKIKSQAKQQDKYILLNFSGSDWCGPCIVFTKDFLSSAEYKEFEKSKIVFVNADFPRKKKNQPAPDVLKANEALAEKYNPKGLFPYTLLLDADGKIIKAWEGKPTAPPADWVSELKSLCN